MGLTVLQKCQDIVSKILQGSSKKTVSRDEVEKQIFLVAGGDPRTINNYIKYLQNLGYIKIKGDKVVVSK